MKFFLFMLLIQQGEEVQLHPQYLPVSRLQPALVLLLVPLPVYHLPQAFLPASVPLPVFHPASLLVKALVPAYLYL